MVQRMKKDEGIPRTYTSFIKPKLTAENVEWRLDYAWSKVDDDCFASGMDLRKIFLLSEDVQRYSG